MQFLACLAGNKPSLCRRVKNARCSCTRQPTRFELWMGLRYSAVLRNKSASAKPFETTISLCILRVSSEKNKDSLSFFRFLLLLLLEDGESGNDVTYKVSKQKFFWRYLRGQDVHWTWNSASICKYKMPGISWDTIQSIYFWQKGQDENRLFLKSEFNKLRR